MDDAETRTRTLGRETEQLWREHSAMTRFLVKLFGISGMKQIIEADGDVEIEADHWVVTPRKQEVR